ncbi:MAG: HNH endonuclease, partial [Nitrospirae bacterium]|nr:HNH endonuclease [Nitrospirota bacterium]
MTLKKPKIVLRPGIINPDLWYPERPKSGEWNRIRKFVLERDNNTCVGCGHQALKYMNIHHVKDSDDNSPKNLATICVACHAIFHIG